jgi:hypothetical protein
MNATIKTIAMAPASSMANDFHFCAAMVRSLSQLLRQTHILAERGEVCTGFSQISAPVIPSPTASTGNRSPRQAPAWTMEAARIGSRAGGKMPSFVPRAGGC